MQTERLREILSDKIINSEKIYIIDSMPPEDCKLSRASRAKICHEDFEILPDKGYRASQRTYFYGYKLHGFRLSTESLLRMI